MDDSQVSAGVPDSPLRVPAFASLLLLILAAVIALNVWYPRLTREYGVRETGIRHAGYDYYIFDSAGENWRAGFDPYLKRPGMAGLDIDTFGPRYTGFIYTPATLPFFGLLSRLRYETARGIWLGINIAALVAALGVALAAAPGRRAFLFAVTAVLVVISHPFIAHVRLGQIDLLVSSLVTIGFLLLPRWRSWPSAALFAIAILLKMAPLYVLLAIVLLYRDWRLLAKTAACAAGLVALSLLAVEPRLYWEYASDVVIKVSGGNSWRDNQALARSLPSGIVRVFGVVWLGIAGATCLVLGRRAGLRRPFTGAASWPQRVDLEAYLLAITLMLLFSPIAWHTWFVWTIVPVALVLTAEIEARRGWMIIGVGLAAGLWATEITWRTATQSLGLMGSLIALTTLLVPLVLRARSTSVGSPGA